MQRVGAYRSVAFDDGAIHAAIEDMGGWPAVCRGKADELPFLQKRFTDLHRAYSSRPEFVGRRCCWASTKRQIGCTVTSRSLLHWSGTNRGLWR